MLRSMVLGGWSEELAEEVGLYDVLNVPVDLTMMSEESSAANAPQIMNADPAHAAENVDAEMQPGVGSVAAAGVQSDASECMQSEVRSSSTLLPCLRLGGIYDEWAAELGIYEGLDVPMEFSAMPPCVPEDAHSAGDEAAAGASQHDAGAGSPAEDTATGKQSGMGAASPCDEAWADAVRVQADAQVAENLGSPAPQSPVGLFTSSSLNPIAGSSGVSAMDVECGQASASAFTLGQHTPGQRNTSDSILSSSIEQWASWLHLGVQSSGRDDILVAAPPTPPLSQPLPLCSSIVEVASSGPLAVESRPSHGKTASKIKPRLALRKDAPVIKQKKRGRLAAALEAGRSRPSEILAELRKDEVAATTNRSKESRWKTWCRLHKNMLPHEPVLPLTLHSIAAVTAQMKDATYSATADYVSTAKAHHLRAHEWTTMLARQQNVCVRSALRGIGAGAKCEELLLADFVAGAVKIAGNAGVPAGFHYCGVVAYFFCLREIEMSTMLNTSVCVQEDQQRVTILLPATKTDPQALSCERTWGCTCEGREGGERECPVHAAIAQKKLLVQTFGPGKVSKEAFPFMPSRTGGTMSKQGVVGAVSKSVVAVGQALRDSADKLRVTGHFARIGGVRHLYRHGVQLPGIMRMARFDSHVVMGYLKDVPLLNVTQEFKHGAASSSSMCLVEKVSKDTKKFSGKVLKQIEALVMKIEAQEKEMDELVKKFAITDALLSPPFIISDKYQKWHEVLAYSDLPKKSWKTHCGWAYGFSVFERRSKMPDDIDPKHKCPRCFRNTDEHSEDEA